MNRSFIYILSGLVIGLAIGSPLGVALQSGPARGQEGEAAKALQDLRIFEAATLKPLVDMIKGIFEGYTIYDQAAGSVQLARMINDLRQRADLFISIDSQVVDSIMIPGGSASWYVVFATSSMVLVYKNSSEARISRLSALARQGDWAGFFDELLSGRYRIGMGNPDRVPQGYRTILVLKLAGMLLKGDENYYAARLNDLVDRGVVIYARDAAAIVGLLQSGAVDVSLTYLHEAVLYNLGWVELHRNYSLSDPGLRDLYSRVSYTTNDGVVIKGAPIEIVATIPATAANREAASKILMLLLTDRGRELVAKAGLKPLENPELRGSVPSILGLGR